MKTEKAIARIKQAYEIADQMGKTLIAAYSGGKDSDVLLDLAIKSGVPFCAEHNHTTADAPQTVYHIREVFKRLTDAGIPNKINYPETSMWRLIERNGMPPTRLARYCCVHLKERRFEGQHIMTGVRWDESAARARRGVHEKLTKRKESRIVYMDENDDAHKLMDICQMRNRVATNPIIDWTDEDVWEYIGENGIEVNPLYSQGFKRVGCVGCPFTGYAGMKREFKAFPKYRQMYLRAFDKMLAKRKRRGLETSWQNAESVYNWWIDPKFDPNQVTIEDLLSETPKTGGINMKTPDLRLYAKRVYCGGEIGDKYWQVGDASDEAACCSQYCAMRAAEIEVWDN